jgi:hypothetical protein
MGTDRVLIDREIKNPNEKSQLASHEFVEKIRRERGMGIRKAHKSAMHHEGRYGKRLRVRQGPYKRRVERTFRRNKPRRMRMEKRNGRLVRTRRRRSS